MTKISKTDAIKAEKLIKTARQLITRRYEKDGHHSVVGVTLITKKGNVYSALNIGTHQPTVGACAEQIAIGMAHSAEENVDIDMIVAIRSEGTHDYIISPCGRCREYIADYSTNAKVIVPNGNVKEYTIETIRDLLPVKYAKQNVAYSGD